MKYRSLGASGIEASVVGLGTWVLSKGGQSDDSIIVAESAREAVQKAVAAIKSRGD